MGFKIESLRVKNFKCFDNSKFYEFKFNYDCNPIILSGPNGFGKTTFFDAIELIFTNNITRLDSKIENQKTNLGGNLLLNNVNELGYLILTLINEDNTRITIFVKIKNITKLTIDTSLEFTYIDGYLDIEKFDSFLENVAWYENLYSLDCIDYIKEHFNVYYYISQAESVHFLKKTITERKDSMNSLLSLNEIQEYKNRIENLIGKRKTSTNAIINDERSRIENELNIKLGKIKNKIEIKLENQENVGYNKLLKYSENQKVKAWDLEEIAFSNKVKEELEYFYNEIDSLVYFNKYIEDYKIYLFNSEIESLIENKEAIKCYIKYFDKINNFQIDDTKIKNEIDRKDKLIKIFQNSEFFIKNFNIDCYTKNNLYELKKLLEGELIFNVNEIDELIIKIKDLSKIINLNQKTINDIIKARTKLNNLNTKDSICPFCGFEYENSSLLQRAYEALTEKLSKQQDDKTILINDYKQKIELLLSRDAEFIKNILGNINILEISKIQNEILEDKKFLNSEKLRKEVLKIDEYISQEKSWFNYNYERQITEIESILNSKIKDFISKDFTVYFDKYNFKQLLKDNEDLFLDENRKIVNNKQENLLDITLVENKKKYIKYKLSILQNNEISDLKKEVLILLQKQNQMKQAYEKFKKLDEFYNKIIEEYKNETLNKLRIPLLIYTGKILQDYQNGLGVFINKEEMRFVSNGNAKHDILNTFSSGQLSAFILSFLFSMNKRYISNESKDIGFILIDDPVQTMDDINITSFIEVLRNDFKDKQIIISTHEEDKENYILYKFLKYNLKGQSFNVKDNMYK
ncbi:MAG: AAA family ATPase [Lachnospirales bacterium]